MKKNIPIAELKYGMYVAQLDRPWTDTPFMFQGFVLETEEQLELLKKFCKTVFVDEERVQVPVEREVEHAKLAHTGTQRTVREVLSALRAHKTLDANSIEHAVTAMTESVLRNPDARERVAAKRTEVVEALAKFIVEGIDRLGATLLIPPTTFAHIIIATTDAVELSSHLDDIDLYQPMVEMYVSAVKMP